MKFIEIFEYILWEKEFDTQQLRNIIDKAEDTVIKAVNKVLDNFNV